jgi:hypothetical protein
MSTTHDAAVDTESEKDMIKRTRRRLGVSSTSAKTAQKAFGTSLIKEMLIPKVFDNYNHFMGAVDTADQL